MEIFTGNDGDVIFKKYSPLGELSAFAADYMDALAKASGLPFLVCDRDRVVSVSGISRKAYAERSVSPELEMLMFAREVYTFSEGSVPLFATDGSANAVEAVQPIISAGDFAGSVVLLSAVGAPSSPSDAALILVKVAASVLGRLLIS